MSVETLCAVCEAEPATRTCDLCGRSVCDDHYDRVEGVCAVCAGDDRETDAGPTAVGGEDDVGPTGLR
jgi:hypothetical protein